MTQTSAILLKKLHELELELYDVINTSLETEHGPRHKISFHDVAHRIEFLKTLYTAEVDSQAQNSTDEVPPQNTGELQEIAERITALETVLNGWNALRTSALSNNNGDDADSVCSDCVYGKRKLDFPGSEAGKLYDDEDSPKKCGSSSSSSSSSSIVEKKEEAVERIWGKIGMYCGVFGSGVIVGAICVLNLFSSFEFGHDQDFLHLPPT